jgi:hypothetical protein
VNWAGNMLLGELLDGPGNCRCRDLSVFSAGPQLRAVTATLRHPARTSALSRQFPD